ncbi:hypothetical protein [Candidatus Phytoplasma luffae]|uniref:hypothetical protein n=1 Tax=Loofah witches'-broom phytoplasma TaxID=35773 RepID=UPI001B392D36|nr:hypothetical protein [Candidatus Phytoplasma luffae]
MVVILGFTFIIYKEELDKNGKQKVDFNKTSKKNRWNFLWLFMISEALLVLWLGMKRVINLKLIPQDYIKIFKFIYNIVFFLFSIYLFLLWCSFTLIFYNDF